MTARQILATKGVAEVPVSAFSQEQYIMNESAPKPMKTNLDTTKTPHNRLLGHGETKDFVRYSKGNVMEKSVKWAPKIPVMAANEKKGPQW